MYLQSVTVKYFFSNLHKGRALHWTIIDELKFDYKLQLFNVPILKNGHFFSSFHKGRIMQ